LDDADLARCAVTATAVRDELLGGIAVETL
jgi:hypothetical protein